MVKIYLGPLDLTQVVRLQGPAKVASNALQEYCT
jgi:hypothetical protein